MSSLTKSHHFLVIKKSQLVGEKYLTEVFLSFIALSVSKDIFNSKVYLQ